MSDIGKHRFYKYAVLVITVLCILGLSVAIILSAATDVFNDAYGGVGRGSQTGIRVPIVMYHSILKQSKDLGKFVITPDEFESDLKYLKDMGYNSITVTDLINYVYNDSDLPSKPVIITLDDGYYNNYVYATPILERYEIKAVVSIVGEFTEKSVKESDSNVNYSYVTWDQIRNMNDSGYYEIQNHTYKLHSYGNSRQGAKRKKGESLEAYKSLLNSDLGCLQERLKETTGIVPNTFTYPFGFISNDSIPIIKAMGFKATLSCAEGVNFIDRNKTDILFGLKRRNRPHGVTSERFFKNFCP